MRSVKGTLNTEDAGNMEFGGNTLFKENHENTEGFSGKKYHLSWSCTASSINISEFRDMGNCNLLND